MQNIAAALSDSFDWLNPEANIDVRGRQTVTYFTDWTKPLPYQGFLEKPKIPYMFFFNYDLRYLHNDLKASKERYKSSLRISVPAARYELPDIEETAPIFSKSVVTYNKEVLLGIQNWPERRRLGFTHRRERTTGEVKHDSRIISIQQIVEDRKFD